MSYAVSRRTREIGVCLALGASPRAIFRQVARSIVPAAAVGAFVGILLSIAMGWALRSELYGVTPADPLTLAGVLVLFLVVTGVATLIPARRAARLDPLVALRSD